MSVSESMFGGGRPQVFKILSWEAMGKRQNQFDTFRFHFFKILKEEYRACVARIAALVWRQRREKRAYGGGQPVRTNRENYKSPLNNRHRSKLKREKHIAGWKTGPPPPLEKAR